MARPKILSWCAIAVAVVLAVAPAAEGDIARSSQPLPMSADAAVSGAAAVGASQSAAEDSLSPAAPSGDDVTLPPPPVRPQEFSSGALSSAVAAVEKSTVERVPLQSDATVAADALRVEIVFSDRAAATTAVTAAGGTRVAFITSDLMAADVPVDRLKALESAPGVLYLQLPANLQAPVAETTVPGEFVVPMAGTSGGDIMTKVRVATWHARGYRGKGVSVGIIDSFGSSLWNAAVQAGEVPAASGSFCSHSGNRTCSVFEPTTATNNHGVGVAEAIHDIAPEAKVYLANVWSYEDLKGAIDYFAANGVRIISRSLGAGYDGRGMGDGEYNRLAAYAVSRGITWFNSAGNPGVQDAAKRIGGYWRGAWKDVNGDGWLDFTHADGTTSPFARFNGADCGQRFFFGLRWSDATGPATDYDLYYFNAAGSILGSTQNNDQTLGAPAIEKAADACPAGTASVGIYKRAEGNGSAGDVLEMLTYWFFDGIASNPYSAGQPISDSATPGVVSIGAIDPVAGATIASYSAWGPTNDGRLKPDFSVGANYTSFAYRSTTGRFSGTSAATPVAAGAAALVLQRYPTYTPAAVVNNLQVYHLVDRGLAGPDTAFGRGELILDQLYKTLPTPTISGTVKEGYTLTAATAAWVPAATSYGYQWYREATPISGATKSTLRLTSADAGQRIRVQVSAARAGYLTESRTSAYTAKVASLALFTTAPAPRITGTLKIGQTLTATPGAWSPAPTSFRYQWRRDGVAIAGATARTYKIQMADGGHKMSVLVTAVRSGYRNTNRVSAYTAVVPGGCATTFANGGFESGATSWTTTPATGIIHTDGQYERTGTGYAWLGGWDTVHTDVLSRVVTVPAGCTTTLSYYLWATTNETDAVAYDTLTLRVNGTALQTFSNVNASTGYVLRSVNLSAYAGQAVTITWTAVMDAGNLTSFMLDDTALASR